MANKLTNMAKELLMIEEDLSFRFDYSEKNKPTIDDFELYTFEQVWESTSLGFGGVGGQALTSARTYVLVPVTCNQKCFIYIAGRFAYSADYCEALKEDIRKGEMEPVFRKSKYRKTI